MSVRKVDGGREDDVVASGRWIGHVDFDCFLLLLTFLSSLRDPSRRLLSCNDESIFLSQFSVLLLFVESAQSSIGHETLFFDPVVGNLTTVHRFKRSRHDAIFLRGMNNAVNTCEDTSAEDYFL